MSIVSLGPDGKPWGTDRRRAYRPRPMIPADDGRGYEMLKMKPVPRAVRIFLNPFKIF